MTLIRIDGDARDLSELARPLESDETEHADPDEIEIDRARRSGRRGHGHAIMK